jgi:CRISPR-associated endonuclease/helicase Cas3
MLEELIREFGDPPLDPPGEGFLAVTGLVCVADWIASDEASFPLDHPLEEHLKKIDSTLDGLGFFWPKPQPGLSFEEIFGFQPNEIQNHVYELAAQPGLILVEAPMGSGKTEAALWAAYRLICEGHNHGLYFALPTRLASNLVHQRVNRFLERVFNPETAARLLHGQTWLYQVLQDMFGGGEELRPGGRWFAPDKRGLLWPFAVGTVDQALLGVLTVRHFFLRLFGLAGKVVILDEIHSYDMYTGTLIDSLVRNLLSLGASVILLSGTLTAQRRQELGLCVNGFPTDPYPLLATQNAVRTPEAPRPIHKKVSIKMLNEFNSELLGTIADALDQKAAILWICNTVRGAQETFRRVVESLPEGKGEVGLLHSLMLPWDRYQKEKHWAKRLGKNSSARGPALLIATQVVEQSVDLDSDLLITELAPTDMLLQRIGRLWRHLRATRPLTRPECWIFGYDALAATTATEFRQRLGGTALVYAPYVLWRTAMLFNSKVQFCFPEEVRAFLEATYADPQPDEPCWVKDLFKDLKAKQQQLRQLALGSQSQNLPALRDDADILTRYSDIPTKPLLIISDIICNGNSVEIRLLGPKGKEKLSGPRHRPDIQLAAYLELNVLSVPARYLDGIPLDSTPDWVRKYIGEDRLVLKCDAAGRLRTLAGDCTPLCYSRQLGLWREDQTQPEVQP